RPRSAGRSATSIQPTPEMGPPVECGLLVAGRYPLPVRIVLVNWAPIRDGAARGGGVNGYTQALALELVRRGHDVVSLCGGMRYDSERGLSERSRAESPGPCRIERLDDWRGIAVYEVVNSPVLAPSLDQFREPLGEVSAP